MVIYPTAPTSSTSSPRFSPQRSTTLVLNRTSKSLLRWQNTPPMSMGSVPCASLTPSVPSGFTSIRASTKPRLPSSTEKSSRPHRARRRHSILAARTVSLSCMHTGSRSTTARRTACMRATESFSTMRARGEGGRSSRGKLVGPLRILASASNTAYTSVTLMRKETGDMVRLLIVASIRPNHALNS